jgi:hypothetical protein
LAGRITSVPATSSAVMALRANFSRQLRSSFDKVWIVMMAAWIYKRKKSAGSTEKGPPDVNAQYQQGKKRR